MPDKSFRYWLTDAISVRVSFETDRGHVVGFTILLLADMDTTVENIARYDTAHGTAHRDLLGRKKGLLRKDWFHNIPRYQVLTHAITDFKANHARYPQTYLEN